MELATGCREAVQELTRGGRDISETLAMGCRETVQELARGGRDISETLAMGCRETVQELARGGRDISETLARGCRELGKDAVQELASAMKFCAVVICVVLIVQILAPILQEWVTAKGKGGM